MNNVFFRSIHYSNGAEFCCCCFSTHFKYISTCNASNSTITLRNLELLCTSFNIFYMYLLNKYPQLVSDTGPCWGMRCDEAPLLKVCGYRGCWPNMPEAPTQEYMKWNQTKWDECGETVEWNLQQGKMGETLRKTYPDSISFNMKPTWSDQGANSVSHR